MTDHTQPILIDTMIIIEGVRTGCWNGLRGHYKLVTVEKCREEAQSGTEWIPGYVVVTDDDLSTGIEFVNVTDVDRAVLATACTDVAMLHYGERDLWAHAYSRTDDWEAVCADKAAVRVGVKLGWGDRLVSLEQLVLGAGIRFKQRLQGHYTRETLSSWRTEFLLDM